MSYPVRVIKMMNRETENIDPDDRDLLFSMLAGAVRYALDQNVSLATILACMWAFLMTLQARETDLQDGETNITALRREIFDYIKVAKSNDV